ncbi:M56 family metallopeptidase [Pleomorphovibrio marinus]|uniref:M56 family metallopeptidase n=1 Tax=Pleomorphovibrio marinus TaxID=2164132 RepID=UPI000E0BDF4A|nr:M56 family metallopeptidase [Pleomorphovibrio marinus]
MEKLPVFIPPHWIEALGWTLLHSLWQFALIALVVALVTALLKNSKAAVRFNIGFASLLLMLLVFVGTLIYEFQQVQFPLLVVTLPEMLNDKSALPMETGLLGYVNVFLLRLSGYIPALVNIWLLGALVFVIRLAGDVAAFNHLKKQPSQPLPSFFSSALGRIQQGLSLSVSVRIGVLAELSSPVTFGMLKPVVLFPAALALQMDSRQLEAILAHELAHVKRMDFGSNLIQSFMEVLFFYHPGFWWLNQQLKETREEAADEMALGAGILPEDLAKGLAHVANHSAEQTPALVLAAQGKNFPLLNRIKRILGYKVPYHPSPLTPSIMITMIITLLVISLGAFTLEKEEGHWPFTSIHQEIDISSPVPEIRDMLKEQDPKVGSAIGGFLSPNSRSLRDYHEEGKDSNEQVAGQDSINKRNKTIVIYKQKVADRDSLPPGKLELTALPAPPIDLSFLGQLSTDFKLDRHFGDSLGKAISKIVMIQMDSSPDGEKMRMKMEAKLEALQEKLEISQERMAEKQKEIAERMEVWQQEMEPKWQEYAKQMEAWKLENDPKIQEYEEKMKAWAEEFARKMEERFKP